MPQEHAPKQAPFQLDSLTLHLLAMACMLLDHLWATLVPGQEWMTCVGRLAFPIFAFLAAEGFYYTKNLKKYLLRLLIFALLSEIPFDLVYGGVPFYPFHQNVLWTLLLALLCASGMERARQSGNPWRLALAIPFFAALGFLLGTILMTDYYGAGVLTVLVFYLFRGRRWYCFAGQLVCLAWLNCSLLGGLEIILPGLGWAVPEQGLALLALLPIWLYRGRQGPHNRAIQYACYAFYPVHLLILALLRLA